MADQPSLEERLAKQAAAASAGAQSLPPGDKRDALLLWAHECETAAEMSAWIAQADLEHAAAIGAATAQIRISVKCGAVFVEQSAAVIDLLTGREKEPRQEAGPNQGGNARLKEEDGAPS